MDNYHDALDEATGAKSKATEMITEIYVERPTLAAFMEDARRVLRDRKANVIYGTVRLSEQDDETFLAWARKLSADGRVPLTEATPRSRRAVSKQLVPPLPKHVRVVGAIMSAHGAD